MSASELQRAEWLDADLWERLEQLESRHRRVQWEHRLARRDLQRLPRGDAEELHHAWRRYCEAITELDRTTAAIEALRTRAGRTGGLVP